MNNRTQLLQDLTTEAQEWLEKRVKKMKFLGPREQVKFCISIEQLAAVVPMGAKDALSRKIRDVFTYEHCLSLGIGRHTVGILQRRICRGKIKFDSSYLPSYEEHEAVTVADLVRFSGRDLRRIINFGEKSLVAVKKVLQSIGIEDWE